MLTILIHVRQVAPLQGAPQARALEYQLIST